MVPLDKPLAGPTIHPSPRAHTRHSSFNAASDGRECRRPNAPWSTQCGARGLMMIRCWPTEMGYVEERRHFALAVRIPGVIPP